MNAGTIFQCSICGEPSSDICRWCTKDACGNHLCHKCHRCSDCCQCQDPVAEASEHEQAAGGPAPEA